MNTADKVIFRPALGARFAPIAITVAIATISFFVFRTPPTGGFSLAWPIVASVLLVLFIGYGFEATSSPVLLSLTQTGIKPNWFENEILWSNITSVELVEQMGFKFGEAVKIRLVDAIPQPELIPERFIGFEYMSADGRFGDWWRERNNSKPVWLFVSPTEMLLNVSRLDTTTVNFLALFEQHLKQKNPGTWA